MQKIINKLNKSTVKSLHNIEIQMRNNIIMSGIRQTKYNAHTFTPCCIYIFKEVLLKLYNSMP